MWDISVSKNHGSDPYSIRPTVKKLVSRVVEQQGIQGDWADPDFFELREGGHVKGGEVKITAEAVSISLNLDFVGRLVKGKVREAIQTELDASL